MSESTTLGELYARADFPVSLATFIRDKAQAQNAAFGRASAAGERAQIAALFSLADYLSGIDAFDPRMVALSDVNAEFAERRNEGSEGFDRFTPSDRQMRLLARIATNGPPPAPAQTVAELIAAGVRDLAETVRENTAQLRQQAQRAKREVETAQAEAARKGTDAAELEAARSEVEALREEVEEAEETIAELRAYLGKDEPPAPTRRTKIDGETGIYEAATADGETVLEINFQDAEGKTRWRRLPGASLEEARKLRAQLAGKPVADAGDDAEPEPVETDRPLDPELDRLEKHLGRELTDEEIDAILDELPGDDTAPDLVERWGEKLEAGDVAPDVRADTESEPTAAREEATV